MKNLLISCVGAYHDSGTGTGGLVLMHGDRHVIIDKLDCTGMFVHNNIIYRFVRGLQALIAYDDTGIRSIVYFRGARDVHDILLFDDKVYAVSSACNEVLIYDLLGNLIDKKIFQGEGDAWHLNCLCEKEGRIYLAAFGRFDHHREWNEKGCHEKGMVFDIESGADVISGLSGPHHPRFIDGKWMVCNSHGRSLRVFEKDGTFRDIPLGGFTRGFNADENHLYVGVNANRKVSASSDGSIVKVIDRATLDPVGEIAIPFPEVYDILFVSDKFVKNLIADPGRFRLSSEMDTRVALLEKQVELGLKEIQKVREENAKLSMNGHPPETFLGKWKRRLKKIISK
jgi:hypothetical protein